MGARWHAYPVGRLNRGQRIVLVVALAAALYVLGRYIMTLGNAGSRLGCLRTANAGGTLTHWDARCGLHPWVRLVVWLGLTVIWAGCSVALLRSRPRAE